jgi:bifunctional DNA-binding transcriptional regulator/antitoxin component of YhaV-PrlF toxin-antitoxin module
MWLLVIIRCLETHGSRSVIDVLLGLCGRYTAGIEQNRITTTCVRFSLALSQRNFNLTIVKSASKESFEMIDSETRDAIYDLITDRIAVGDVFTAYSITQDLRAEGFRVRHEEVKSIVHQMFEDGEMDNYTRELKDYGGPIPAWEYRPDSTVMASHHRVPSTVARNYAASGNTGGPQAFCGTTVPHTDDDDDEDGIYAKADARGTICVPSKLIQDAGFKPGDHVVVITDPNKRLLTLSPLALPAGWDSNGGLSLKIYTVDKYRNVRITRATQLKAGVSANRYTAELDQDHIVLAPC